MVNDLGDTGAGSGGAGDLRYCLLRANATAAPDGIDFAVTGTINLTGPCLIWRRTSTSWAPGPTR